jgi:membrane-bound lytic murein transglycosylase D
MSERPKITPGMVLLVLAAAPLVLTGCVPQAGVTSSPAKPPQATAPALKSVQPAPPSAKSAATPATPAARPQVQALIDAVEVSYQSGVTHYHAGKLQAAKSDFDHAVDLMLTSTFDLRNEPQLRDEFDHVIDAVNTLELEALKQGNGFAPKIEPAPVDIANDVTFPVDPNVKAQAIAELKTTVSDLPLVINDPVAGFISYFSSKGRGTLMRSLERAGRYQSMIAAVLRKKSFLRT